MVNKTPDIASGQERCVRRSSGCTETTGFPYSYSQGSEVGGLAIENPWERRMTAVRAYP